LNSKKSILAQLFIFRSYDMLINSKINMPVDNCTVLYMMMKLKLLIYFLSLKNKRCKLNKISKLLSEDMTNIFLTLISINKNLGGILYAIKEISGMNLKASIFIKITLIPASSLYLIIKQDKLERIHIKPTDLKTNLH